MVRVFKAHPKPGPVCTLSPCQNRVMAASDAAKTKRNRFTLGFWAKTCTIKLFRLILGIYGRVSGPTDEVQHIFE